MQTSNEESCLSVSVLVKQKISENGIVKKSVVV